MKINIISSEWWGAPRQFTTTEKERKISWLELFYDLVFVLAIAKLTHQLSHHLDWLGLIDYLFFFIMIFWAWLNGSLHHDLHGSEGLRTRLMTLWQMMIIAALTITLESYSEAIFNNSIICLMIMQLFITYQWWSVGIYDHEHRKLNRPYTILYMIAFLLMFTSLWVPTSYIRLIFILILFFNLSPPFIAYFLHKRASMSLQLSSSMTERLGLITIILFGEVIAGVVNGLSKLHPVNSGDWINFTLSVAIVFALWWVFFTLVSDRVCKKGFIYSTILELIYIPTLIALGMMGLAFNGLFLSGNEGHFFQFSYRQIFSFSIFLFFTGILLMSFLLQYPAEYKKLKSRVQLSLTITSVLPVISEAVTDQLPLEIFLMAILLLILAEIIFLNYQWYSIYSHNKKE
jgi:low temperature requirement protein LtrA